MEGSKAFQKKKGSKNGHYIYVRNRVAAFTVLGLIFPCFGFGIVALAFVTKMERYNNTALIPILFIVNLASAVIFLTFWALVLGIGLIIAF